MSEGKHAGSRRSGGHRQVCCESLRKYSFGLSIQTTMCFEWYSKYGSSLIESVPKTVPRGTSRKIFRLIARIATHSSDRKLKVNRIAQRNSKVPP